MAKIGDVGLATMLTHADQNSMENIGTFAYAAPELLVGASCNEKVRPRDRQRGRSAPLALATYKQAAGHQGATVSR